MKYTYTHVFSRTLTRVSPRSLWFLPAVVRESFGPGEKDRRGPQGPSGGAGGRVADFSTFAGLQWMFHDVLNLRRYYYTHTYIYIHICIYSFLDVLNLHVHVIFSEDTGYCNGSVGRHICTCAHAYMDTPSRLLRRQPGQGSKRQRQLSTHGPSRDIYRIHTDMCIYIIYIYGVCIYIYIYKYINIVSLYIYINTHVYNNPT
jgi:hypothetical protein